MAEKNLNHQSDDQDLLYTNPLLSDDMPLDNVEAVLTFLSSIDSSDCNLGDRGLHLIHEWLRRSLAYNGKTENLAIPLSSSG